MYPLMHMQFSQLSEILIAYAPQVSFPELLKTLFQNVDDLDIFN
jgi:hypothetical protein